jgi:hypothetical protein
MQSNQPGTDGSDFKRSTMHVEGVCVEDGMTPFKLSEPEVELGGLDGKILWESYPSVSNDYP